jgi:SP family general alpha glucoside:H+ symporter-like MFS transporter
LINPTEANWQGKTGFFWAGTCAIFLLWTWLRLPETKGRSSEELDILFNEHIGARRFAKMEVDAYAPVGERIKND